MFVIVICLVLLMCILTILSSVLCILMVECMSVVVNVMLSIMSVMSTPLVLCNISACTVVKLCTLSVFKKKKKEEMNCIETHDSYKKLRQNIAYTIMIMYI